MNFTKLSSATQFHTIYGRCGAEEGGGLNWSCVSSWGTGYCYADLIISVTWFIYLSKFLDLAAF